MAVDLGSTFKELIDEINSKSSGAAIDSIDGLKGGTLSSPLTFTGGDGTNAKKAILDNTNNGQITDKSTGTLLGFIGRDFVVGSNSYLTKIRGNANSTIAGKKFSDLAVKGDIPDVSANPTLSGSETELTGLQIGSTKYKIPTGGGGSTLDDLEAEYTEDVNAVPVLDVEETGNWIMVPVSELGGGGSDKKYYNHHIGLPVYDSSGNRIKNVQFNIVSTDSTAFTESTLYLHLRSYQFCVATIYNTSTAVSTDYAAYVSYVSSTQLIVCIMNGAPANVIIFSSSNLAVTDAVTLIFDL